MRIFGAAVTMVGVLSMSSLCRAQALEPTQAAPPMQETPTPETTTVSRWYGAPIFLADGAAYAAMIGGYSAGSPDLAIGGVATYVLGGPITHLVYGHPARAGQSVLVRLVVPVGAALYSAADCQGSDEDCGNFALAVTGFGMFLATVLDGAVFANDSVRRPKKLAILPTLSATRDGAVLGAVGTF